FVAKFFGHSGLTRVGFKRITINPSPYLDVFGILAGIRIPLKICRSRGEVGRRAHPLRLWSNYTDVPGLESNKSRARGRLVRDLEDNLIRLIFHVRAMGDPFELQ